MKRISIEDDVLGDICEYCGKRISETDIKNKNFIAIPARCGNYDFFDITWHRKCFKKLKL
jgi:hypothetical protein